MACRYQFILLFAVIVVGISGCDGSSPQNGTTAKRSPEVASPGPVDADAPEEFTTTESGLRYRIRRKSVGTQPNHTSIVTAHYRGWLDDGELFDSTYGTGGKPMQITVRNLFPGWAEGILLMGEGGMIELEIPASLGFPPNQRPNSIPADATLHMLIEVFKVGPDEQPPSAAHSHHGPPDPNESNREPGSVDPDAPVEFTTTSSGLKYRIRRNSAGVKPTASNTVRVHYRGWIDDGTVFDESYKRGEPIEFSLRGVIAGWTEGLQHVGKGGMIELEIPGKLGYPQGQPPHIKPGATLHFLVELLDVK